jgi:D-glycero-alpha-D-manno-heptose 1-phosphate guanylyltransferase
MAITDDDLSTEVVNTACGTGERWGAKILYSEKQEPLGTGGAIKKAATLLCDEHVVVMNGDSFLNLDLNKLLSFHKEKQAVATIGLVKVNDTNRYGRVEVGAAGSIKSFTEKAPGAEGLINSGIYVLIAQALKIIPAEKCSFERDVLPLLVGRGLFGLTNQGFFIDIGVPTDYLSLSNHPQQLLDAVNL